MDEDEAGQIAAALLRLQKFYPSVDVPAEAMAWFGLASVGTKVYGPRIGAYKLRKQNEAADKKAAGNSGPQVIR